MRLILALAMLSASLAVAEEKSVEIPLKEVWALNMHGTRDVNDLDVTLDKPNLSNKDLIQKSFVEGIRYAIRERAPEGEKQAPAFVVVGTGKEALKNAHAVLTHPDKKQNPERFLPADSDLSLVFYSAISGRRIQIKNIKRDGNLFTVSYQAEPHAETYSSSHFALIPIGKITEGTWRVRVREVPIQAPKGISTSLSEDSRQRLISGAFSFGIRKSSLWGYGKRRA